MWDIIDGCNYVYTVYVYAYVWVCVCVGLFIWIWQENQDSIIDELYMKSLKGSVYCIAYWKHAKASRDLHHVSTPSPFWLKITIINSISWMNSLNCIVCCPWFASIQSVVCQLILLYLISSVKSPTNIRTPNRSDSTL